MQPQRTILISCVLVAWMAVPLAAEEPKDKEDARQRMIEALTVERDLLLKQRRDLQKQVLELQEDVLVARRTAGEAEALRKRIEELEERNARLLRAITELTATLRENGIRPILVNDGVSLIGGGLVYASLKQPRPTRVTPSDVIRGRIKEVSENTTLVGLAIGSDAGLVVGSELQCYRVDLNSRSSGIYLGTVKILRVTPTESVGRFQSIQGAGYRARVGDQVASELK